MVKKDNTNKTSILKRDILSNLNISLRIIDELAKEAFKKGKLSLVEDKIRFCKINLKETINELRDYGI